MKGKPGRMEEEQERGGRGKREKQRQTNTVLSTKIKYVFVKNVQKDICMCVQIKMHLQATNFLLISE